MAVHPQRYRFSVDEYERMGEAGIFPPGHRVELIEGEIVEMVPIGSPHASCVDRLAAKLFGLLVEVADTSGRYDRNVKVPLNSRAGISEVWVVDLEQRRVHRYHAPSPEGYRDEDVIEAGLLESVSVPGLSIDVDPLFA